MGLFRQAMTYYAFVFHPSTVLGAGFLALIYLEWDRQVVDRGQLWRRVGAFLVAGVLAFVPTAAYFLVWSGLQTALEGSTWRMDMLVASGMFVAAGVTWALWHRYEWGEIVPDAMEALALVTVPYVLLSPFWDVSGHVIFALLPTLYLTLLDRRFWPTLAIPLVMVPNRVVLDAHTITQSVVGFIVCGVVVLGLVRVQSRGGPDRHTGPITS